MTHATPAASAHYTPALNASPDRSQTGDGTVETADAATIAALQAELQRLRELNANLTVALDSNRTIGVAIGVLMTRYLITGDSAFELLRRISQSSNRKLRDIAQDVIDTGRLPRNTGPTHIVPQHTRASRSA